MRARWLLLALLLLAGASAYAVHGGLVEIPARWNPWAPLDVREPPGLWTRLKLLHLARDPERCRKALATAAIRFEPIADRDTGPGCGFRDAVRVLETSARVTPFAASCRLAVSLALWERHVVQPAARSHFGRLVVRLEHLGSYACRNLYGRATGRRSRHATADALDVAGFVLDGGRSVRVAADWRGDDREARFLRAVRDGACPLFGSVLGPEYNAAHQDHLHVDRGGFGICR